MTVDDQFMEGFQFALIVLGSMGHAPGYDAIAAQLMSVANGDLTLSPSPLEAIQGIEAKAGKPLPGKFQESIHRLLGDRKASDEDHKQTCLMVLKMMGYIE